MKKRIISSILAAMMLTITVIGCGESGKQEGNESNQRTESAEKSDQELVNIVMQLPVVGDTPVGLEDVENAVNEITESEIGVTVTLIPTNAFNLATETSLAVSSGDQLDICLNLFSGISSLVDTGTVIPLDELLATKGQDIVEKCGNQLSGGKYDNQQYAVPNAYVNGNNMTFCAVKEELDAAGITVEKDKFYSIEELEDIFEAVKAMKGDSYYIMAGGYSSANLPLDALYTIESFDAGLGLIYDDNFQTSNEVVSIYESEEYAEYAQRMYEWAQKGYFSPDASTTTETAVSQMAAGTALGFFTTDAGDAALSYTAQVGKECVGIKTQKAYTYTGAFQTILWGITTTCENPEKAMEFLNLLYVNADLDNMLMYGLEGKSYDIVEQDENGTVIEVYENAPYSSPFGIFGDRLSWYVTSPNTTTTNQEMREFSESIDRVSPALGFIANYSDVSTEYSNISAVIAQYRAVINTGAIEPAQELPEFIQSLKDAGIDTVLSEISSQYESWKAEQ